jgi:hypothetical protein
MPYKYVTYKNGFTEIIPVNLTLEEEVAQMAKMIGVKSFSSVNYRTNSKKRQKQVSLKTTLSPDQH